MHFLEKIVVILKAPSSLALLPLVLTNYNIALLLFFFSITLVLYGTHYLVIVIKRCAL